MKQETDPFKFKPSYWFQIVLIAAGSGILLYGVLFQHKNVFFVIYIFWFQALIHVAFNLLRILKAGKDLTKLPEMNVTINKREFTLADYNNRSYYALYYGLGHLFLLFIYWVFIIQMVGFVIPLSIDDKEMFRQNILIMIFRDYTFVLALLVFFVRAAIEYSDYILSGAYKSTSILMMGPVFGQENLVMHTSLITGIGLWFMVRRFYPAYSAYTMLAFAVAFITIKLIADLYSHSRKKAEE
jgi:hypothetical protein